jgi:hypothetical protein
LAAYDRKRTRIKFRTDDLLDAGRRFSLPACAYTLTKDKIGTRYAVTAVRTLADPNDAKDIQQANSLQDAVKAAMVVIAAV